MTEHLVTFRPEGQSVRVPTGTLLSETARQVGVELQQPCGGQGRCGRCAVIVLDGDVRRRSTLRLSAEDVAAGYALACQSVVEGDVVVEIPPQEKIERRMTTERTAAELALPFAYDAASMQTITTVRLEIEPPSLIDQTDDWSRVQRTLKSQAGLEEVEITLPALRALGPRLRDCDWKPILVLETDGVARPKGSPRLIDIRPCDGPPQMWGVAVDIGTTTVTVVLLDLATGQVKATAAEYNGQIARGEDVISRIIYASKQAGGYEELRGLVLDTINGLIETLCKRANIEPGDIYKATVVGNSTMMHLFLGVDAASIRLMPFITAANQPPPLSGQETGLAISPTGTVDCLPGVASYVGADITAGVLTCDQDDRDELTLFLDVGTNGEMVLGNRDWLVTCACSAGPAFEGAGVVDGMRATRGAIEEVWVNSETYEPTYRVIGDVKPRGLCGSALISLLAELFITGAIDKGGHFNTDLDTPRVRQDEHGAEYVIAWADETAHGRDIVLTTVDIDNLLRVKAAIYAGFTVLADSVGVALADVQQVLIGGAFGKYINVEKAVQIGLLPDLPWDRFQFLGNTAVRGALVALASREHRQRVSEIAAKMTYIELSADNTFYDAFTSALFLPHTDITRFPSVEALFEGAEGQTKRE
jgi:uncharacterized 2Fe-2S/4Fe-4S cluster protein (DUF4445 family)